MKKNVLAIMVVAALLGVSTLVFAEGGHQYIGVKKCSMCHKSASKGNQYGQWLGTRHAKAYEALGSAAAKEAAAKSGVTGNPQEAPECLKCHVTGYGADASQLGKGYKKEDGVQCEACHGAGGDYWKMSTMKDKAAAVAGGLVIPSKEVCVKCHNEESPNFKGFNFDEYKAKIAHPRS